MRRWGLVFALLLSVGVNLGILGTLAVDRLRSREGYHREEGRRGGDERERRDQGERAQRRLERLADRMDLEGEVRERFLAQQRRFFLAASRDRLRLRQIHADLRRELTAREPDRRRIDALAAQAGQTYLSLERAMAANVLAAREMLDPQQEEVFLDFVARVGPRLVPRDRGERSYDRRRRSRGARGENRGEP